jgi:nickel-dependent lactate racemase
VICRLPFANDRVAVDLRGFRVRALRPAGGRAVADPGRAVAAALDAPRDTKPLREMARGCATATVVVPDATRAVDLPRTLPPILDRLGEGVPHDRITVLVACGTHPPATEDEISHLVGELPRGVTVVQHDSRDEAALRPAGPLPDGRTLRLSRHLTDADLLVTMGAVRHHYFAGFGGGPKMIFPGAGEHDQIQHNHARVFRPLGDHWERHPMAEPGRLAGNPVAEEIALAADLRPPDLAICLVPAAGGGFSEVVAGRWRTAFTEAVDRVRAAFEIADGPFDLVVASGGGHPSDGTLIQAHKGLDAACRFAAPGAEILYVAAMTGGAGSPAMGPFLDDPDPERLLDALRRTWVQYGHTTFRLVDKTSRFRVHLHSVWKDPALDGLGFHAAPDPAAVVARWREERPGATVGVMADGAVYPITA